MFQPASLMLFLGKRKLACPKMPHFCKRPEAGGARYRTPSSGWRPAGGSLRIVSIVSCGKGGSCACGLCRWPSLAMSSTYKFYGIWQFSSLSYGLSHWLSSTRPCSIAIFNHQSKVGLLNHIPKIPQLFGKSCFSCFFHHSDGPGALESRWCSCWANWCSNGKIHGLRRNRWNLTKNLIANAWRQRL